MNTFIIFLPLIVLTICFIFRVPIGLGMIISCLVYFLARGNNLGIVADTVMSQIYSNSVFVAMPLFIFAANVMNSGKVTEYMFGFTKALVGRRRGAMAYINIIVSLIFSGMSGFAMSDVAGLGTIEIEEMRKDGYDMPFSCAITAATSVVGPIFPPSIPMVVYAMIAGVSVGKLFMGGVIPAVMICGVIGVYVWYISRKRKYPMGNKFTFKEFLKYTLKALPALMTPVILLGGIYTGFVTATEAGVLATAYTIIIAVIAYRVLRFKAFIKAMKDTVIQTGIIFAMVAGAYVLSYVITSSGINHVITDAFLNLTTNRYVFLFIVNIVFMILGMFFGTGILQFVFLPLFLPIVNALGIDLVYFGVVITVNMMLGGCSPPYGILCYVVSGLTGESLGKIFKEVMPMVIMMLIVLLLITYIPSIIMLIPNLMVQ